MKKNIFFKQDMKRSYSSNIYGALAPEFSRISSQFNGLRKSGKAPSTKQWDGRNLQTGVR
jgi:hypothetical protein